MKILIIGGGAGGMAAAIEAVRTNPENHISIIEKNDSLGKKILASGNGRCNLTNKACDGAQETLRFFSSLGLMTRLEDEGRYYPRNGRASSVLNALTKAIEASDINVILNASVSAVNLSDNMFKIAYIDKAGKTNEEIYDRVLLAAGGKAGPQFGTTGDSYVLARKLGLSVKPTYPGLTSLECLDFSRSLKGIRQNAEVNLYRRGKLLSSEIGEVQFTENGISGIAAFNLSRYVSLSGSETEKYNFSDYKLSIDLTYDLDKKVFKAEFMNNPNVLWSTVNEKLAAYILQKAGIKKDIYSDLSALSTDAKDKIFEMLSNLCFTIAGAGGWKNAQLSCGGVELSEVNADSFEAKKIKGLYIVGEALDYAGPCGGFNLQFAFESGRKAGKYISLD